MAIALVAVTSGDLRESESISFDLGQPAMSMMITAADVGIGSRHVWVLNYDLGAEILRLPDDVRLNWLMGFGYSDDRRLKPIVNPARRPFEEIVRYELW